MDPGNRASSENPRKRVKLEEPDEQPFQNHPTLYFPDGSVILRTGGTLFCVHRTFLAKHSPVFRELFRQDDERFRGLPHYTMEETREDLEVLLNVIYDGLHINVKDLTVDTFPTLATVLRMATKYKIERPCHPIVARIRQQWPANLADHDAQMAQVRVAVPQQLAVDDKGKAREAGPSHGNVGVQQVHQMQQVQQVQQVQQMQPPVHRGYPEPPHGHQAVQWNRGPLFPAANVAFSGGPAMHNYATNNRIPGDGFPQFQAGPFQQQPPPVHQDAIANQHRRQMTGEEFSAQEHAARAAVVAWMNDRAQNTGPSNVNPAAPAVGPAPGPSVVAAAAPAEKDSDEDLIIHPASVIAVLRECGYSDTALFFPLFYALSRTTGQFGGGALGHHLAPLSAADMERVVVGVERLRARHTALVVSTPAFDSLHCCQARAQELWKSLAHTMLVTNEQRPHEPIEEWQDMAASVNAQHGRYGICPECCKGIVAKIQTYRVALWDSLPRFFELA
ncbi:hypothetical protein C8T65DRAFT_671449 [Cerioporus squamosus]|nr:hypothetical protein C8T65DRAFT_671449 [Cerioporus squamosus]